MNFEQGGTMKVVVSINVKISIEENEEIDQEEYEKVTMKEAEKQGWHDFAQHEKTRVVKIPYR